MKQRLYHVIAVNEKTQTKAYCTKTPVSHNDACNILKAFSYHPVRTMMLEEVVNND